MGYPLWEGQKEGKDLISYHETICGMHLQIDTPRKLHPEMDRCIFRGGSGQPDVRITLFPVPEIPESGGKLCRSSPDYPVRRQEDHVVRCCQDAFRENVHFRLDYSPNHPEECSGMVREDCWDWATREKYLWNGIQLNVLLLYRRGLIFHASYIAYQGNAVLFTAPSQTGKSTQADLWQKYRGAEILNGDKAGVELNGVPMAHGVPFSGTSGICRKKSYPLKAMVVLSQTPENTVRKMKPVEAVQALCPNLFVDQAVAEEQVPVYALACTPDVRAVEELEKFIS